MFWQRTDKIPFFVGFDTVYIRLEIPALRKSFVPLFSGWSSSKEADILDYPDSGLSKLFRTVYSTRFSMTRKFNRLRFVRFPQNKRQPYIFRDVCLFVFLALQPIVFLFS